MKTIGLIGGMSWESTIEYYRLINQAVKARLGGLHSAKCVLYSADFAEVAELQREGNWPEAARLLAGAAQRLEQAGADMVLICTNTMHCVADDIQAAIRIPLLHIVDATGASVCKAGIRQVGLLGTRFTMEQEFYRDRLCRRFGLEVLVPKAVERENVHRIIYEELCIGDLRQESRGQLLSTIDGLAREGAEGIILGCTELGLLVHPRDTAVPLFDTTREHAIAAVDRALE